MYRGRVGQKICALAPSAAPTAIIKDHTTMNTTNTTAILDAIAGAYATDTIYSRHSAKQRHCTQHASTLCNLPSPMQAQGETTRSIDGRAQETIHQTIPRRYRRPRQVDFLFAAHARAAAEARPWKRTLGTRRQ